MVLVKNGSLMKASIKGVMTMRFEYKINKHTINFEVRKAEIRKLFTSYGRLHFYIKWTTEVCALMSKIDELFSTEAGEHWVDRIIAPEDTEEGDDNAD